MDHLSKTTSHVYQCMYNKINIRNKVKLKGVYTLYMDKLARASPNWLNRVCIDYGEVELDGQRSMRYVLHERTPPTLACVHK